MEVDGAAQSKALKFRELVYSIETGEAEMIGVDSVARGGGPATAVEGTKTEASKPEVEKKKKGKGKQKKEDDEINEDMVLTAEDEERKSLSRILFSTNHITDTIQFSPPSQQR